MRSVRSSGGFFSERLFFDLDEIDDICLSALKQSGFLPESPQAIRIERFVEKHFTCVVDYRDLGAGILGCTKFNTKGKVEEVLISSRLEDGAQASLRRARTTFAHEAGHGLLHASLFMDQGQQDLGFQDEQRKRPTQILCRDNDVCPVSSEQKRAYDGKWWEFQANRAIGGLLLPKSLIKTAVIPYLDGPVGIGRLLPVSRAKAIHEISEVFEVNPIVVKIRLSEIFEEDNSSNLI